jgi:hypothetical protein
MYINLSSSTNMLFATQLHISQVNILLFHASYSDFYTANLHKLISAFGTCKAWLKAKYTQSLEMYILRNIHNSSNITWWKMKSSTGYKNNEIMFCIKLSVMYQCCLWSWTVLFPLKTPHTVTCGTIQYVHKNMDSTTSAPKEDKGWVDTHRLS